MRCRICDKVIYAKNRSGICRECKYHFEFDPMQNYPSDERRAKYTHIFPTRKHTLQEMTPLVHV